MPIPVPLIEILLQMTLLLAGGLFAAWALRHSPSRGHAVLTLTVLGLFAVPPIHAWVSSHGWGLLPPGTVSHGQPGSAAVDGHKWQRDAAIAKTVERRLASSAPARSERTGTAEPDGLMHTPVMPSAGAVVASGKTASDSRRGLTATTIPHENSRGDWWGYVLWAWLLTSSVCTVRLLLGGLASLRLRRSAQPLDDDRLGTELARAAADIGIRRPVSLYSSPHVHCPMLWCWQSPAIVVPEDYRADDTLDWRGLFAHELAHFRRRDPLWSLVSRIAHCLLPWHPLLALARVWLSRFSERACDEWALNAGVGAARYARSLLAFAPSRGPLPLFTPVLASRNGLVARIEQVLSARRSNPRIGPAWAAGTLVSMVLVLGLCVLTRPRSTAAQEQQPKAAVVAKEVATAPGESVRGSGASKSPTPDADGPAGMSDEGWRVRLTTAPEGSRWTVGWSFGKALSAMPGDRAYEILQPCWPQIATDVRKQMLKTFQPSFKKTPGVNKRYFDIMLLGFSDKDAGVREFATTYLNGWLLPDITASEEKYRQWQQSLGDRSPDEVLLDECAKYVKSLKDLKAEQIPAALEKLAATANNLREYPALCKVANDHGLLATLDRWEQAGLVEKGDRNLRHIRSNVQRQRPDDPNGPRDEAQQASGPAGTSDEDWRQRLRAAPEDSRWFVGWNFGKALSAMPGDRAYEILKPCWPQIATNVRKQMLKTFQPSFKKTPGVNKRYFDIMLLGFSDKDAGVREFATAYLNDWLLPDITASEEKYRQWQQSLGDRSPEEVLLDECAKYVKSLQDLKAEQIPAALEKLAAAASNLREYPALRQVANEHGLHATLDRWEQAGLIEKDDHNLRRIRSNVHRQRPVDPNDPRDEVQQTIDEILTFWRQRAAGQEVPQIDLLVRELAEYNDPRIIAPLIGIIDADNSYHTVYRVGYFGLSKITGVEYSPYHDGAWWKRWWNQNRARYTDRVKDLEIPVLPKTQHGRQYVPFPENIDTLEGKLEWLIERFRAGADLAQAVTAVAEHNDPRAIPTLIGVLDADNTPQAILAVGHYGLEKITGVPFNRYHDGPWWRRWWKRNQARYADRVADFEIPDLPKTEHGRQYVPFPAKLDTLEGKLEWLTEQHNAGAKIDLYALASGIGRHNDPRAIPTLIALVDADNSASTIRAAHIALSKLTGVECSQFHDGPWWKRWWQASRARYADRVTDLEIPVLRQTAYGRQHVPFPAKLDTLEGKLEWMVEQFNAAADFDLSELIKRIAEHEDPRAIPTLIAVMEADTSGETVRSVESYGLWPLTGVSHKDNHDGAWWKSWWQDHKNDFPAKARDLPIPDLRGALSTWNGAAQARQKARLDAKFAGIPATELRIPKDERMRYLLIGPAENQKPPAQGWKLFLIVPDGDRRNGVDELCRGFHQQVLPPGYVAVQLLPPVPATATDGAVWPTRLHNPDGAPFCTEDLIAAVVEDIQRRLTIDKRHIFAFGWSSGTPAVYSQSLQPDSPVTGSLVLGSVFVPQWLPDLRAAKDHAYYILNSQEDRQSLDRHARPAAAQLGAAGAKVKLQPYEGHSWPKDTVGQVRRAVEWLERQTSSRPAAAAR